MADSNATEDGGNDVSVSVVCDATKAAFRFPLFIFLIHILKHKAPFCKQFELQNTRR